MLLRDILHVELPSMLHQVIVPGEPLITLPNTFLVGTVHVSGLMGGSDVALDIGFAREEPLGHTVLVDAVVVCAAGAFVGVFRGPVRGKMLVVVVRQQQKGARTERSSRKSLNVCGTGNQHDYRSARI